MQKTTDEEKTESEGWKKEMSFMRRTKNNGITFLYILLLMFSLNVACVFADTDGTELQVAQPEILEVQLGEEWAGVQFQLMTDAGQYPEIIAVGDDGILSLELGGSSKYTLSCLSSSVAVPVRDEIGSEEDEKEIKRVAEEGKDEKADVKTVAGIPTLHIVLFSVGMIFSIATLLIMKIIPRHRDENQDEYDED